MIHVFAANFRIPVEKDIFEEILFPELDRTAAEAMVKMYNMQGTSFKKAPPAPGAANPLTEPTGPKFRPDRSYGAPPPAPPPPPPPVVEPPASRLGNSPSTGKLPSRSFFHFPLHPQSSFF